MKKSLTIKITVVLSCLILTAAALCFGAAYSEVAFAAEKAQVGDVTEIASFEDLIALSEFVNSKNSTVGKAYSLTADIVADESYVSIGTSDSPFNGTFDGCGHSIEIIKSFDGENVGVFGVIGNRGTVKNLRVDGEICGVNSVGGVVGLNYGRVESCLNAASVGVISYGGSDCGGIVGNNHGTVTECVNAGKISGHVRCGGVIGRSAQTATVEGIVNLGLIQTVAATGGTAIGGVVGENTGFIADGYNFAELDTKGERTGSVVGSLTGFPEGSGKLYNIKEGSTRETVGYPKSAVDTFESVSYYRLLARDGLFSGNKLVQADYGVGYGYLHSPQFIVEFGFADLFKKCLFGTGDGTKASPFIVGNAEEWGLFSANSEEWDYDGVFITVVEDINLGRVKPAFLSTEFSGSFDGRGNVLTFSVETDGAAGLFGAIGASGLVKNAVLNGTVVSSSKNSAGILAATSSGRVTNVKTMGSVSSEINTGGIIGKIIDGNVDNCENSATVSGVEYLGGIAGSAENASVANLRNFGAVGILSGHVYDFKCVGGVFGIINANTTVSGMFNCGEISAYKATHVGGIAGRFEGTTIEQSASLGDVSGRTGVGGIVGFAPAVSFNINDCAVVSTVFGAASVGGLNGTNGGMLNILRSYFYGKFGEVSEASIDRSAFFATAPSVKNATDAYYCEDLLFDSYAVKTNATGKTGVEFTEGLFFNGIWNEEPKEPSCGYLPIPVTVLSDSTENEILSKKRYAYFGGGNGEAEPYIISTEQHLRNASYLINKYENYRALSYRQTSNLVMKRAFDAIGKSGFNGVYDGKGRTISEITLTDGYLFDVLNGEVVGVSVESGSSDKSGLVNTVAESGKITESYSLINVTASGAAGGLCIANNGEISASFFAGRIVGAEGSVVGGIAAESFGGIINCFSSAYLSGSTVGGIVGTSRASSKIDGCVVSGTVNGLGNAVKIGGFAGSCIGEAEYKDSFITAIITVNGKDPEEGVYAGALVGWADGVLTLDETGIKYNTDYAKVTAAYFADGNKQIDNYYRVTAEQMCDDIFDNAFNGKFTFDNEGDKDSKYAPKNKVFIATDNERVDYLSSEAVKIRLFGWDNESEAAWGGEENPYLISSMAQLGVLREMVINGYDYTGCYFELLNDIDFLNMLFRPIGRYVKPTDSGNRTFNGVFDGNGHTFSNLTLSENADYGYVALFPYAGSGAKIENLILDASCAIDGASGSGSFVGFNNGEISHCISHATVSGKEIGGIAAVSLSGTKITDCVFIGSMDSENSSSAYGIISQETQGLKIDTTNSWYAVKNVGGEFVEIGRETYRHNGYGSVVYEDRRGSISVKYLSNGFNFFLTADAGYTAKILNTADGVVYDETKGADFYDPMTNADVVNGASVRYYARFTLPLRAEFLTNADRILNADDYGSGNYYEGQRVKFTFKIADGYFIDGNEYYDEHAFTYANEGDAVALGFAAPPLNGAEAVVPVNVAALASFAEITFDGGTYTGEAKTPTITGDYEDKLEFSVAVYYGDSPTTQISVAEVNAAGNYTVKFRIILKGGRSFMGTAVKEVSVSKAEVTVSDDADWAAVAGKEYDGTRFYTATVPTDYYGGVIDKDRALVGLTAKVTFDNAEVSEGKYATVNGFALMGVAAGNYRVTETQKTTYDAKIWAKTVTVEISAEQLTGEYAGVRPELDFSGIVLSGNAEIKADFKLLKEDGSVDDNWDGGWNVGSYQVIITCTDSKNYKIVTEPESGYIYEITPKIVYKVTYSGFNGLVYTGEALKGMNGIYDTIDGGKNSVEFEFEYLTGGEAISVNEILNAGYYVAKPIINEKNFILSSEVYPCEFTVMKANSPIKLTLEFDGYDGIPQEIEANEEYPVTVGGIKGDDNDEPKLKIEIDGASSAKIEIKNRDGKYYVIATKYAKYAAFKVRTYDSVNFEDRESETYSITINAKSIYYAISKEGRELIFGDVPEVNIIYSFDESFEKTYIYDEEIGKLTDTGSGEKLEISGFSAPKPTPFNINEIRANEKIVANFYGGYADAYELRQNLELSYIEVKPRAITVYVSGEDLKPKFYGDSDEAFGYSVQESGSKVFITELPDGREIVLNGELSRDSGETVGAYGLQPGTLTTENNPDYILEYNFVASFKILQRMLNIRVDAVQKEYGAPDSPITYKFTDGTGFAYEENESSIRLEIVREEGEALGEYPYRVNYSESENYIIVVDYTTNKYTITKAKPTIYFRVEGTLNYGDTLNKLSLTGSAYSNGKAVSGTFDWMYGNSVADTVGNKQYDITFTPNSENYSQVDDVYVVDIKPREAIISYEGTLAYVYNGARQCDIKASVLNPVGDDEVKLETEIEGTPINVGSYKYKVTVSDDRYVVAEGYAEKEFTIYKANVTVTAESATIQEGDSFTPKIKYEGFVNGENESVLKKRASVKDYSLSGGYHTLTPSGAEGDNYEFVYISGTLTVNKTSVTADGVTVNGDIGPSVTLKAEFSDESALIDRAKLVDKGLKHNAILPNPQKIKAYYNLEFSVEAKGEFTYFVKLDFKDGDKIYAVAADGTVAEITEYEIVDASLQTAAEGETEGGAEGVIVTFKSQALAGIALYTEKTALETVKSYLPLAAILFGAAFIVCAVITFFVQRHKKDKRREKYLKKYGR